MEMVAASKMKKAVQKALSARVYGLEALKLMVTLSKERNLDHALLKEGKGSDTLLVMISANKGLCGGYNASMFKRVSEFLKLENIPADGVSVVAFGKYAEKFSRRKGFNIKAVSNDTLDTPSMDKIEPISGIIIEEFLSGQYKRVVFFYTKYISALSQKAVYRTLLPMTKEVAERVLEEVKEDGEGVDLQENMALYLFEPTEEELLEEIIPRLINTVLYQGILEAVASEHSARMMAMRNATDNAGTLVSELTLNFNRARQASVTREISEIAAGAEALSE